MASTIFAKIGVVRLYGGAAAALLGFGFRHQSALLSGSSQARAMASLRRLSWFMRSFAVTLNHINDHAKDHGELSRGPTQLVEVGRPGRRMLNHKASIELASAAALRAIVLATLCAKPARVVGGRPSPVGALALSS